MVCNMLQIQSSLVPTCVKLSLEQEPSSLTKISKDNLLGVVGHRAIVTFGEHCNWRCRKVIRVLDDARVFVDEQAERIVRL